MVVLITFVIGGFSWVYLVSEVKYLELSEFHTPQKLPPVATQCYP